MASNPSESKPRRLWRRLGILAASLVVACLLAELGVTLIVGELPKFPRAVVGSEELGLRINLPGARYRHTSPDISISFRINSQGMRDDREFPYEKPPGRKRIVSLGDSFTIGYEVEVEDCFSSIIEDELRAKGHDVEVLNAGVSGYSNAEQLLLLEREMLRYDPDVVICSFFLNDIVDNVRTGLFTLEEGELVQTADEYVPLGGLWNFLNKNRLLLWLSSNSNAFVFFKEEASRVVRHKIVADNLSHLEAADENEKTPALTEGPSERVEFQRTLCARIFDRMYQVCHERGIQLVIQSIPRQRRGPKRLVDAFPTPYIDLERPGLWAVPSKYVLEPFLEKELLYWENSHRHWTPFAHRKAGEAIAAVIHEANLLDGGPESVTDGGGSSGGG